MVHAPDVRYACNPSTHATGTSQRYGAGNNLHQRHAVYIANHFQLATNGRAKVVTDLEVGGNEGVNAPNLVLIGGPEDNMITHTLLTNTQQLGVVNHSHVQLGPCHFVGAGFGVAAMLPINRTSTTSTTSTPQLALVLAGVDPAGLAAVVELATPTIPPMVRPHSFLFLVYRTLQTFNGWLTTCHAPENPWQPLAPHQYAR
jgi:hypothetical protein